MSSPLLSRQVGKARAYRRRPSLRHAWSRCSKQTAEDVPFVIDAPCKNDSITMPKSSSSTVSTKHPGQAAWAETLGRAMMERRRSMAEQQWAASFGKSVVVMGLGETNGIGHGNGSSVRAGEASSPAIVDIGDAADDPGRRLARALSCDQVTSYMARSDERRRGGAHGRRGPRAG